MASKDKSTDSVYRVTEVIGTSAQSWEDLSTKADPDVQRRGRA